MKEETISVEEFKIVSKKDKMFTITFKNWDYLLLLLSFFSFTCIFLGFWETETILWNRIVYSTGSQWRNADPIYRTIPLPELTHLLLQNFGIFIFGNILFLVCTIVMIFHYLIKKSWFKTSRTLLMINTLLSLASGVTSFWIFNSVPIIASFPGIRIYDPVTQEFIEDVSGNDWIRIDLAAISPIIEALTFTFFIIMTILLVILVVIVYVKRNAFKLKDEFLTESKRLESGVKTSIKSTVLSILKNLPFYIILFIYLIFTIFPLALAVIASISAPGEIGTGLPSDPLRSLIVNYSSVMFAISVDEPAFSTSLLNSLFLSFGTSFIGLVLALSSGYALSRFKFRGKSVLTFVVLSTQMFPAIILLIPQYIILSDLGFIGTDYVLIGLLLVMATGATAYCVWMMKGYFETIPVDIEEAALIDGYGKFATFIRIAIPLAKAGMVAVMVYTFLSAWQEFVLARTFIGESSPLGTLPLLFYNYQNLNAPDNPTFYELLTPYSIIVAAPVVVFYMILQSQLVSGVIAGGIK